jgi:Uma2 family endonuclease
MEVITKFEDLDLNKLYTYADYLTWNFNERVELIKGKIFKMSPAPSSYHQLISGNLHGEFKNYLKGKKCLVFSAPFDVRLTRKNALDRDVLTVVQPDLCIICDKTKIDKRGCLGAPDLIVEILSPGNDQIEVSKKYELYESNRVKEYWLVFPYEGMVQVYALNADGKYTTSVPYASGASVRSLLFPDLELTIESVFEGLDFDEL